MKKTFKALKFSAIFLFSTAAFVACDKDFTVIESNVLGENNSNFNTNVEEIPITAYNKKLESVQVNGLASYLLGVYNDPAYGQTTASIITQVSPSNTSGELGDNPTIDSVVVSIPYYSRTNDFDDDGNALYTIQDSLYGDYNGTTKPFKLSIYQNNYFLRNFDPAGELTDSQKYYSYSDGSSDNFVYNGTSPINFDANIGETILEPTSVTPSANPIILVTDRDTDDEVITRSVPAFRVKLDTTFWHNTIIKKNNSTELSNSNNFSNYFRGLFFKAEAEAADGSMILLNMGTTAANITIYYQQDSATDGETVASTYVLTFSGNTLNSFTNDITEVTLADGDDVDGDETLYLKGAGNAMVVVDLFEDEDAKANFIDDYRVSDGAGGYKTDDDGNFLLSRLINDAQLIVFENDLMQGANFPQDENGNDFSHYNRIYAYDIENSFITSDYSNDVIESSTDPFNSKLISLGQRVIDENDNYKYKIRLTEHLNNILVRNSTNTKIGLVLSSNVNYTTNAAIADSESDDVTNVPAASIITPEGTILYGSNVNVDDKTRMKLKVFYTAPNN
ncbi:DUF4270 domain-containing protein [Algibacter miyuki]|uniref:DUF4270 domain-containing protein n=1 Tax=Algibacter miyuki TaxID=1306933 RepID=A0ABV5GUX9_9FLAO|nr:DUF4270 domain-containing protein [Algibacter miyuki]MDN3664755.1 DUF4270 domain-containing protein [Algibacter miyuki]